jgi:hypothetical protein
MKTAEANGRMARVVEEQHQSITISAPRMRVIPFKIEGTAPYVGNKFSEKAKMEMVETQRAGSQAKSKRKREPKNFELLFEQAKHLSEEGWAGIPAPAFRSAMIDACRLVNFKMTFAKLSVFVLPDGLDRDDGTPLVRIHGDCERHEAFVKNATGVADIRWRPMWRRWSATIKVQFDLDQFSETDVANLLMRAGMQVGVGAGRPNSKDSFGQGWGTFAIKES